MTAEKEQMAMSLANYLFDDKNEEESYKDWISEGNNPVDHVYHIAATLLGEDPDGWGKL